MPTDLELTHDERFVLAAGSRSEGLLSYARDPATGALTPSGCLVEPKEGGCWYVHGSGEVDTLEVSPDDRFVFTASIAGIGVVSRDPATGALSQAPEACIAFDWHGDHQDSCPEDPKLGAPLNMDLSPDGRTLYVTAQEGHDTKGSGGLSVFAVDPATGALSSLQRLRTQDDQGGYMEVTVAPDGRDVYAITENWEVHAFTRDAATGELRRIPGKRGCVGMEQGCAWIEGVIDPEDIRIPDDGRHVYLAGPEGVAVLARDRDGGLRQLKGRAGCVMVRRAEFGKRKCRLGRYQSSNITGLEIAPGGRHLYVLQANSDGTRGTGVVQLMKRR
jgi:hypothetical protein